MANIHGDGFNQYNSIGQLIGRYAAATGTIQTSGGLDGLGYLRISTSTSEQVLRTHSSALTTHTTGLLYRTGAVSGVHLPFMYMSDVTPTIRLVLGISSAGVWTLWKDSTAGTVLGSGGAASANVWYRVELKVTIHASTGTCELRIDNNVVFANTGLNTGSNDIKHWTLGANAIGSTTQDFDDWYINDTTGSINTGFLGGWNFAPFLVDADGATLNWTRSSGAGTHTSHIDEALANGDTDYLKSTVVGDRSEHGITPGIVGSIKSVIFTAVTNAPNSTPDGIKIGCKSGAAAEVQGAKYSPRVGSNVYGSAELIQEADPNTGIAWTTAALDAVTESIEHVA